MIYNLFVWMLGLMFSISVGHVAVKYINKGLRKYIGASKDTPAKLTPTMGCIERAIYTTLTVFQQPALIATFLGIKIAERMITYTKLELPSDIEKAGEHGNVFIICNIISLGFGILGGLLILYLRNSLKGVC